MLALKTPRTFFCGRDTNKDEFETVELNALGTGYLPVRPYLRRLFPMQRTRASDGQTIIELDPHRAHTFV